MITEKAHRPRDRPYQPAKRDEQLNRNGIDRSITMAQVERQKENARDQRAKARANKLREGRAGRGKVDMEGFPWPEFVGVLRIILDAGGAVRIGRTRDGGAWAFGLYGLGDPLTLYMNSNDDPFEFLEQIKEAYLDNDED